MKAAPKAKSSRVRMRNMRIVQVREELSGGYWKPQRDDVVAGVIGPGGRLAGLPGPTSNIFPSFSNSQEFSFLLETYVYSHSNTRLSMKNSIMRSRLSPEWP